MVEKSVEFSGGTIIELDLVFEITFCVLPTTSLEKKKVPTFVSVVISDRQPVSLF